MDPHKVRRLTIVGSDKMAVFDDLEAAEKLQASTTRARSCLRNTTPSLSMSVCVSAISRSLTLSGRTATNRVHALYKLRRKSETPVSDGQDGLRVVQVLDAAQRSLKNDGVPVEME